MARIIDTSPAFEAYARTAFLESAAQREQQWKDRYEATHGEVFEAFYAKEPATDGRKALVRELSSLRQRVAEAAPAMATIIEEVDPQVQKALGVEAKSSPVHALIVGPSSTNAVVGRLGDDVALFHCLEWFRSADGARILAAHEDAHAWHEIALGEQPPDEDVTWMAFSEGMAIAASREVVPGRPDDDYFWFGYDGFEDWLGWCQERRDELVQRFTEALDDPGAFDTFFGAGLLDGRWRVGYFVADEVVKALGRSLPELAAMSVAEAQEAVRGVLKTSG